MRITQKFYTKKRKNDKRTKFFPNEIRKESRWGIEPHTTKTIYLNNHSKYLSPSLGISLSMKSLVP